MGHPLGQAERTDEMEDVEGDGAVERGLDQRGAPHTPGQDLSVKVGNSAWSLVGQVEAPAVRE